MQLAQLACSSEQDNTFLRLSIFALFSWPDTDFLLLIRGHSLGLGRDRCGLMSMLRSILRRASSFSCFSFSSIRDNLCSSDDILKNGAPWNRSQQSSRLPSVAVAGTRLQGGPQQLQAGPQQLHTGPQQLHSFCVISISTSQIHHFIIKIVTFM